jgi:hypothetical protein
VLAFSLLLAACNNGSTGGKPSGNTPKTDTYKGVADGKLYTLKITQKEARFAVLEGDKYELKVESTTGTKTSAGTVGNVEGGVLTLKPSKEGAATFTVTVPTDGTTTITEMSGTITFTDTSTEDAPSTLTPIENGGIDGIEGDYTYATNAGGATVMVYHYSGSGGVITIPSTLGGKPVTILGDGLFYQNASITGVTIPNSVITIGYGTFAHCPNLTSVTIGNSVTSIGESAFAECAALTGITIPGSVTTIGDYAFTKNGLTGLTIPNSVTTIGKGAFDSNPLTSLTIGNSLTKLSEGIFANITSLTSVIIPSSVKSIEKGAFGNCTNLTSVKFEGTIPASDFSDDSWAAFEGDLRAKFYATNTTDGTPGTYTTTAPVSWSSVWTK